MLHLREVEAGLRRNSDPREHRKGAYVSKEDPRLPPASVDAGEPLEPVVQKAMELVPASGCAIELCDHETKTTTVVCGAGDLREIVGSCTLLTRPLTALELASSLSVPLISRGASIGTLGIRDSRRLRSFSRREMDLLGLLADQAVLIVENFKLQGRSTKAASKLEDLVQFLSVVSHDLRTPLSSIIGFTDILITGRAGSLSPLQQEFLGLVKLGAGQLNNLVADLLDISRLTRGELKLYLEEVNLSEVVARMVRQLQPLLAETDIRLVNRVGQSVGVIRADSKRLDQVLSNLLNNAIKFTQPSGTITISSCRRDGEIILCVADTGIGIAEEERVRVFERFYQSAPGLNGRFSGSGLGLAVSKHIVEAHGGRIWVESKVGKGSKFRFSLPSNNNHRMV